MGGVGVGLVVRWGGFCFYIWGVFVGVFFFRFLMFVRCLLFFRVVLGFVLGEGVFFGG